jgi:hypothetical protein
MESNGSEFENGHYFSPSVPSWPITDVAKQSFHLLEGFVSLFFLGVKVYF